MAASYVPAETNAIYVSVEIYLFFTTQSSSFIYEILMNNAQRKVSLKNLEFPAFVIVEILREAGL